VKVDRNKYAPVCQGEPYSQEISWLTGSNVPVFNSVNVTDADTLVGLKLVNVLFTDC